MARGRVDRAHIAVKDDVRHPFFGQDPRQERGPVCAAAGMAQQMRRIRPEELVPRIERASPDLRTRSPQHLAQPVKERAVRTLQ
jgi:hypothetical protein